jgi:hypothetical protein
LGYSQTNVFYSQLTPYSSAVHPPLSIRGTLPRCLGRNYPTIGFE